MSEKVLVKKEYYELMKKELKAREDLIKIGTAYVRNLLHYAIITAKKDKSINEIEANEKIDLALLFFQNDFSSYTEEELDKILNEWEKEVGVYTPPITPKSNLKLYKPEI